MANTIIDTGAYDYILKQSVIDLLELPTINTGESLHPIDGVIKSNIYTANFAFVKERHLFENAECKVLHSVDYPAEFIIGTFFLHDKSFHYNWNTMSWSITWDI